MQFSIFSIFNKSALSHYNNELILILLASKIKAALTINIILPLIYCYFLLDIFPIEIIILWLVLNLIIIKLRLSTAQKLTIAIEQSNKSKELYLQRYINILCVSGLLWGLIVSLAIFSASDRVILMGFTFVFGLAAGSVTTLGSIFHGFLRFILLFLGPIAISLLLINDSYYYFISLALVLFSYFCCLTKLPSISSISRP